VERQLVVVLLQTTTVLCMRAKECRYRQTPRHAAAADDGSKRDYGTGEVKELSMYAAGLQW
jgi:hypothetical protein